MNKQQWLLIGGAVLALFLLYIWGPTVNPKKSAPQAGAETAAAGSHDHSVDIDNIRQQAVAALSPQRQQYLAELEAAVKRGDVQTQEHTLNHQLASFWRDSVPNPLLHYYYLARVAELDNTEKSITFAAHSILGYLPYAGSHTEQHWLAVRGKELFEKALSMNPANDSSIVGLGGCLMYGAAEGADAMQGIVKVREVAERDSNNVFAQYMLGIGGMQSRQFDRAAARFEKVARAQPDNLEVLFKLAEAYELMGERQKAADWYGIIAAKVDIPQMKAEIEKRIAELKR